MEADEAVGDIDAVWFDPDPVSRSNRSVRVIGYSPQPPGDLDRWESNPADQRRYREAQ
ncbi:MAG: hypothetical protein WCC65_06765 [Pseudonocardiaceae bacterium]